MAYWGRWAKESYKYGLRTINMAYWSRWANESYDYGLLEQVGQIEQWIWITETGSLGNCIFNSQQW